MIAVKVPDATSKTKTVQLITEEKDCLLQFLFLLFARAILFISQLLTIQIKTTYIQDSQVFTQPHIEQKTAFLYVSQASFKPSALILFVKSHNLFRSLPTVLKCLVSGLPFLTIWGNQEPYTEIYCIYLSLMLTLFIQI